MSIFFRNVDDKTYVFNLEANADKTIGDFVIQYLNLNLDDVYFTSEAKPVNRLSKASEYDSKTIEVTGRMKGGKGGFGSLLKGQPAVKKRTKNFDACRDISGRRIRHVNQEKQLIEWQQKKEEEERIVNQANTGNAEEIKKKLLEEKRNEIVKENNRFFEEDKHTRRAVEKSIKFLAKKRNRDNNKENKKNKKQLALGNERKTNKEVDIKELIIKDDLSKEELMNEILAL